MASDDANGEASGDRDSGVDGEASGDRDGGMDGEANGDRDEEPGGDRGDAEDDVTDAAAHYVGDVLELVERIPPGRVLTYGDIARLVGIGGPRQVGQVMSRWGSSVPWWRVLRADGRPPTGHEERALRKYAAERTPMRPGNERVDLPRARWDIPA